MKIIDHTPFIKEKGDINFLDKIKGSLKYGLDWVDELEAQKAIIAIMEKYLGNKYVLLRNIELSEAGVTIPMMLIGPPGIFVFSIVYERGLYSARGESWGMIEGDRFKPAKINLLSLTDRMARALQIFLERQGMKNLPPAEPVLLAADPGIHINSVRPIIRVVLRDAIDRFAVSLTQSRIILSPEAVQNISQRIITPRQVKSKETAATEASPPIPATTIQEDEQPDWDSLYGLKSPEMEGAEEETGGDFGSFPESELEFEFEPEPETDLDMDAGSEFSSGTDTLSEHVPAGFGDPDADGRPSQATFGIGGLRFTTIQWALLGGMLLVQIIILIVFVLIIFSS